ncbi:MAG: 3-chlorobenzoate-3,4-dioxygenase dihydrogenase related protein [Verrucomicrobiaceae bacterium]|nr:3-chlorobenzoate-3,4-dioxygenase dihydrogenase related protein [Verrucomicrobiaceae bacterium]
MNRRHFITTVSAAGLAFNTHAADAADKLRVVVIGHTGRGNYGHGIDIMWATVPGTEIIAVADADENGLAAELKKLKVAKGDADYRQMLSEVKADIVAIGPRHIDQHRDMCLAAIAAGARGIYMEKPFCRSLAEADEIIAAAEKTGTKIAIAHRNRYQPVVPVIDGLIKDGTIGQVLELRARGKEDKRGGSLDLWVLGSHVFNLAAHFAGNPMACTATLLQDRKPVTKADVKDGDEGIGPLAGNEVHARFETESGIPVFFDSVHDAGTKEAGFGLQIIGTKGVIDLRMDADPVAQALLGTSLGPIKTAREWTPISTAGIGKPEPVASLGKQVMTHTLGGLDLIAAMKDNRQPLCSAYDARTAIEMISAVFESHRLNGQRVTFPLKTRENPLALL